MRRGALARENDGFRRDKVHAKIKHRSAPLPILRDHLCLNQDLQDFKIFRIITRCLSCKSFSPKNPDSDLFEVLLQPLRLDTPTTPLGCLYVNFG